MEIDKNKALSLFVSTLLFASLLLTSLNSFTNAQPSSNSTYLHGPTLIPIHMHSLQGLVDLAYPLSTAWHELYPIYCKTWSLTSWEDIDGNLELSPTDQIDMIDSQTGDVSWFFVDRLTITLLLSGPYQYHWHEPAPPTMAIELKLDYYDPNIIRSPIFTKWHEVWPTYSNVYNLTSWVEDPLDPDGQLSFTDSIDLTDMKNPQAPPTYWHIEDVATDLILNEKITDPVSTTWHELYPHYCNNYLIDAWKDNNDGLLSPSDSVTMTNLSTQIQGEYDVTNVMLTLTLRDNVTQEIIYIESMVPFESMYIPKIWPYLGDWQEVYPEFGLTCYITNWIDNCNGVLDHCDYIQLDGMRWLHVEEVAVDIVVEEVAPPPTTPPMYWKPSYPHYAPSGMPDFNERQDGWNSTGAWTWCAPTAVANSLWWMDSRFHPSNMLTAYGGAISEHDPSNVIPFITHLAYFMDTDGIRTVPGGGAAHTGTWTWDMETGIAQYLSWTGVNPKGDVNGDGKVDATDLALVNAALGKTPGQPGWNMAADIDPVTTGWPVVKLANNIVNTLDLALVTANMGKNGTFYEHTEPAPKFDYVEKEVEKCEDVVLVLGFWYQSGTTWYRYDYPYQEGSGHAVTVAGINSTAPKIATSDPDNDAFHDGLITQGRVPVAHPPYPHGSNIHNNASLVSQDIYDVAPVPQGFPAGIANFTLVGYPKQGFIAVVEAAVITSPLGVHDVSVTDVKPYPPGRTKAYRGFDFLVDVTVKNKGEFAETFNVTLYANASVIGKKSVTLAIGANQTTRFTWTVPLNFTKGNYKLKAVAELVGDANPSDNEFTDGVITVTIAFDLNGDGKCNLSDLIKIAGRFGCDIGMPCYLADYDLNIDGKINLSDLIKCAGKFGNTDP